MPIRDLKDQIARLPEQPGVYLYLNGQGETIYVGKARSLRDRVRTYLGASGTDPKTDALLDEIDRIEVIVTDSVVEALALENNLIKQRSPRYNILLRDDKNYPYLQLTTAEACPRLLVARRVARDGNVYAGPFLPASLARKTMSLSHRLFGIRSCNEVITGRRGRPCLEYDIKRCIAPCVEEICTKADYARAVEHARLFLEGRNDELMTGLKRQMNDAAVAQRYEQAAELRDSVRIIETLRDRQQKMATARLGDRDAFGVKAGPEGAVIQVFQMRGGRVIERVELIAERHAGAGAPNAAAALGWPAGWPSAAAALGWPAGWPALETEANLLQAALQQFYEVQDAPPEIHIPVAVEEMESIAKWLTGKAGRRVRLVVPKRGDKRGLLELAARNAAVAYASRFSQDVLTQNTAIEALRAGLGLPATPRRIECFDVSTIQGSETVGSMVVCEDGRLKPSEYRKYRVRGSGVRGQGSGHDREPQAGDHGLEPAGPRPPVPDPRSRIPNDFAAMHEIVVRRYRRLLEQGGPFPDLVIVDGGKGQLSAAYEAFGELGLANLMAVGIAKQEELIVTRDASAPIALPTNSPALLLIERIRDEAHRVAVSFHRQARAMRDLRSELDNIPGVGPRRRRLLLRTFGSVANVRRATREELAPVVGRRVADAVLQYFVERSQETGVRRQE